MLVRHASGVRVGALTIDPTERVATALWTHRPARRPPAGRALASAPLARRWPSTLALPFGAGAVAMGFRIELLPTGYGPGGAAVLLARGGERTLVVGPTTEILTARRVDRLVLFAAPPPAPDDWLSTLPESETLVVPDAAAAEQVSERLRAAGLVHRRPAWLGRGRGPSGAPLRITTRGPGRFIDARPQASEDWLVRFAGRVSARAVFVHGPSADHLARALAADGQPVRVLHGPQQLSLLDEDPAPFTPDPLPLRPAESTEGPERR